MEVRQEPAAQAGMSRGRTLILGEAWPHQPAVNFDESRLGWPVGPIVQCQQSGGPLANPAIIRESTGQSIVSPTRGALDQRRLQRGLEYIETNLEGDFTLSIRWHRLRA